ncbi:hypothetical protein ACFE04_005579 [Oxalis oulophora]
MGNIRIYTISFLLTSILLSLIYIPNKLTNFKPVNHINSNAGIILKSNITYPVTFAYLISASKGDANKIKRLIRALYHPANYYLIHLDYDAPKSEHTEVAKFIANGEAVFGQIGNVWMVGKPNLVTYRGPTMLATTLHGMAILLKICKSWDWFINLSASDYPLVTQDDLPRDLNFVEHTSRLGWKLNKRGRPIMIDPGLYSMNKSDIWWAVKQRTLPTAFKLYTGSAWTILSRSFSEYTILGYDNLPRTLLLYYTNFVSSPEGYFQTLICNSESYQNTTANHDLHYITWDTPPKQHPRSINLRDFRRMVLSNRPFARKFKNNAPVLNKIDRELLKRNNKGFGYGGWCDNNDDHDGKGCLGLKIENYGLLKPGPGSKRLKSLLTRNILVPRDFTRRQCK